MEYKFLKKVLKIMVLVVCMSTFSVIAGKGVKILEATVSCCYNGLCTPDCGAGTCTYIACCDPASCERSCHPGNCGSPPGPQPQPQPLPPGCPGGFNCPSPPPGPPPPPPCQPTYPVKAPTLVSPADFATNLDIPVAVSWTSIGGLAAWGEGCPTNRAYYVYTAPYDTVTKTCGAYGISGLVAAGTLTANLYLKWGVSYCWKVGANNGPLSRVSAVRHFTTNANPVLVPGSNKFLNPDTCGGGSSGAPGQVGVTNPVQYTFSYQDPDSNDVFQEAWISVSTSNAATYLVNQEQALARNANMFSAKIDLATGGVSYVTTAAANYNQLGTYSAPVAAGNLTIPAGNPSLPRVTITNIGTQTKATVAGNVMTATFQIQFEKDFPVRTIFIYGAALAKTQGGTGKLVTSSASGAYFYVYQKLGTWKVDTTFPTITLLGPNLLANGTYNVYWLAQDNIGVGSVFPYITSTVVGARIKDNTKNLIVITSGHPESYPTDPVMYTGVTLASQGWRNYTDQSAASAPRYSFSYYARDTSCNISVPKTVSTKSIAPWILVNGGDASGGEGITKETVPPIASFTIPFSAPAQTGPTFFTSFSALSGAGATAEGVVSKYNFSALNYIDKAASPDEKESSTGWYDYLLDTVKKNAKSTFTTFPLGNKTFLTKMSTSLGVVAFATTPAAKNAVLVQGDLTINSATVCDVRAIVFVSGNLTLNPDFTLPAITGTAINANQALQTYPACMFIVKGNVTIGAGTIKTVNIGYAAASQAGYDIVNAFIVTDGIFNTPKDTQAATLKYDALYFNGGVVDNVPAGQKINLKRDLNLNSNTIQPATVFNYDPRYKLTFIDDFASRIYSLREVGI